MGAKADSAAVAGEDAAGAEGKRYPLHRNPAIPGDVPVSLPEGVLSVRSADPDRAFSRSPLRVGFEGIEVRVGIEVPWPKPSTHPARRARFLTGALPEKGSGVF